MEEENSSFQSVFPLTQLLSQDDEETQILSPLTFIKEFETHWLLEVDLPLVKKDDITITIDSCNLITINAKLKEKFYIEKLGNRLQFQFFRKNISFPVNIDKNKISAKFSFGRLSLTIPKKKVGRRIKVE